MRSSLLISLSLLLLSWQTACAQLAPADDFFNSGAQFYISNNIPKAKEAVDLGLKFYPDDEKLKKLEELLKQQNQQQSQQNQQQQNQQDQSQQQKSNDQKNQQRNPQPQKNGSQDQQKQDEQKQNQADQQKAEQEKQKEQQKSAARDKDKQDKQEAEGQPVKPGEMTPAEAKRLLDAQKGDEQFLQLKPPQKPEASQRKFKDW